MDIDPKERFHRLDFFFFFFFFFFYSLKKYSKGKSAALVIPTGKGLACDSIKEIKMRAFVLPAQSDYT